MWKLEDGREISSRYEIRTAFPDTSFPANITDELLAHFGAMPIQQEIKPEINTLTHVTTESAATLVNGVWTKTWITEELSPEVSAEEYRLARNAMWWKIKAERDARKEGGTFVSNKWFHSDRDSRIQQLGLVLMGANVPAIPWKTMDGTFINMSYTIAMGIFQATATLDMELFAAAEIHNAAMQSDPLNYDYSGGWPARYTPS